MDDKEKISLSFSGWKTELTGFSLQVEIPGLASQAFSAGCTALQSALQSALKPEPKPKPKPEPKKKKSR